MTYVMVMLTVSQGWGLILGIFVCHFFGIFFLGFA